MAIPSITALFDAVLLDSTQSPGVNGQVCTSTGKGILWMDVEDVAGVMSVNGMIGDVTLVLPQTFTPVDSGSPPEPAEFLTGYDAGTGLFSASALAPTSATMTFIATVEYPGTVGFLTDATYAAPYFATTDPTSVTIMGSKSLTITLGSMGNTTTLAALDLSGLTDLQNFTYREGA